LGDEPKFFDQFAGTNSGHGSGYNPLYPFGFGLSYTTFSTSGLAVSGPSSGTMTATFDASNTGGSDGTDVVPVYVSPPAQSDGILRPSQQLVGFARVKLGAGHTKKVSVSFPLSELAVTSGDIDGTGSRHVLRGTYVVHVGSESASFTVG
jgi:beta-glucosidase